MFAPSWDPLDLVEATREQFEDGCAYENGHCLRPVAPLLERLAEWVADTPRISGSSR